MHLKIQPMSLRLAQMSPLQRTLILSETVIGPLKMTGTVLVDVLSGLVAIGLGCLFVLGLNVALGWMR